MGSESFWSFIQNSMPKDLIIYFLFRAWVGTFFWSIYWKLVILRRYQKCCFAFLICPILLFEEIYTWIKGLNWPLYINKNWKPFVNKNKKSNFEVRNQSGECVVSCCNSIVFFYSHQLCQPIFINIVYAVKCLENSAPINNYCLRVVCIQGLVMIAQYHSQIWFQKIFESTVGGSGSNNTSPHCATFVTLMWKNKRFCTTILTQKIYCLFRKK